MRIKDTIKVAYLTLFRQKFRNLLAILVTGALFGILFGLQFISEGMKQSLLHANQTASGNDILFISAECMPNTSEEDEKHIAPGDYLPNSVYNCREDQFNKYVTDYGGKIIGHVYTNHLDFSSRNTYFVPKSAVANFHWGNFANQPTVSIPVILNSEDITNLQNFTPTPTLNQFYQGNFHIPQPQRSSISTKTALELIQKYDQTSFSLEDGELFIARVSADPLYEMSFPQSKNFPNPLNNYLPYGTTNLSVSPIIFFDGNSLTDTGIPESAAPYALPLAKFTNLRQAYAFSTDFSDYLTRRYRGISFVVNLFGNQTEILTTADQTNVFLTELQLLLIPIACIIMIITFIILIHQQTHIIALYRSLGATRSNLVMIYATYLLGLCFLALCIALIIGSIFALIVSFLNSDALSNIIIRTYMIERPGFLLLWGLNWQTLFMCLTILLIPVPTILIAINQLSAQNIAKRLHAD